jgi:muconolactone delta-isomerase
MGLTQRILTSFFSAARSRRVRFAGSCQGSRREYNRPTMQFVSISKRKAGFVDADYLALVEAEVERARELYKEGLIRQIWHRGDTPGACLLWEADTERDVREMLDTLPFARAGMLDISIIPLKPFGGFCNH